MKIGCVLVLYNPNIILLSEVLDSVINQVDFIFLSDNSTKNNSLGSYFENYDKVIYSKMPTNIGIAAAQNVGVKYFINQEIYTHIIFLDQDSIMEPDLVFKLLNDLNSLCLLHANVGGIGARPINRASNKKYKASINKGNKINDEITEVNELISSSSLIPIENFKTVGLFDESLFIDGVDHEWCWRAKKNKLKFYISERTLLSHQLGEGDRFFLIRSVAIPTPFRIYYQFRNYFILVKRDYVPVYWKLSIGFKYCIKVFYFPLFVKPRIKYLKNILKGIRDGLFQI